MGLPKDFIDSGLEEAKGMTLFGVPLESLTRDELLAATAQGWKSYHSQFEESSRRIDFMRNLRTS